MILGILFIFGFLVYRISCSLKFKTFNVWREVAIWIFFIYLVVVANLTLFKHGVFEYPISIQQLIDRVNLVPLVETYKMLTDGWIVAYSWYQVIANILVLIPLGFLTPILFKSKSLTKWWHILIVGCSTSLLIEVFQILTPQNVVDVDDLIKHLKQYNQKGPVKEEAQSFEVVTGAGRQTITIQNPTAKMAVGTLQNFLDDYLKHHGGTIDYIHGGEVTIALGQEPGNVGFLLPPVDKSQLFPTVVFDGALPRKTFSMGHAWDKRYYLECRKMK